MIKIVFSLNTKYIYIKKFTMNSNAKCQDNQFIGYQILIKNLNDLTPHEIRF